VEKLLHHTLKGFLDQPYSTVQQQHDQPYSTLQQQHTMNPGICQNIVMCDFLAGFVVVSWRKIMKHF
jgi:hypothetical protein